MNIRYLNYISLLLLLILPFSVFAQDLEEEPEQVKQVRTFAILPFTEKDSLTSDIENLLTRSTSHTADSVLMDMLSLSEGQLSEDQKDLLFTTSKRMYLKRFPANKDIENYYACVAAGGAKGKFSSEQLTRFMQIADSVVALYPANIAKNFLHRSRLFLEEQKLYHSRFHTIIVEGGTVEFGHIPDGSLIKGDAEIKPEVAAKADSVEQKEEWFGHLEEEEQQTNTEGTSEEAWPDDNPSDESSEEETESWDDAWDGSWEDSSTGSDTGEWSGSWDGEDVDNVEEYEEPAPNEAVFAFEKENTATYDPSMEAPLPDVLGPFMEIKDANFRVESIIDTVLIEKVSGSLLLKNDTLVGSAGRMFWSNLSIPQEEAYCDLPHYAFDISSGRMEAGKAELHFLQYTDSMVRGRFEYQLQRDNTNEEKAKYPFFQSYGLDVVLKGKDGVKLVGGLTIRGKKMNTGSLSMGRSSLEVFQADTTLFVAKSKKGFVYNDSLIYSPAASMVIYYQENDSLQHDEVAVRYDMKEQNVTFRRSKGVRKYTPFNLSFHKLNIDSEFFEWDLKADSINIKTLNAANKVPTFVESDRFFHPSKFKRLQGLRSFHPLVMIYGYAWENRTKVVEAGKVAESRHVNPDAFRKSLWPLTLEGLIEYNTSTDQILLKDEGIFYHQAYQRFNRERKNRGAAIDSAKLERVTDFDNLALASRIESKSNATLNLRDSTLKVRGVSRFAVSDSLNVKIIPSENEVIFKQNRDMQFGGTLTAGNLVFRGSQFDFEYDSFKVVLTDIDSVSFLIRDQNGATKQAPNSIVNTGGILYVSHPNNKSGLVDIPPRFHSENGGRMNFDHQVNSELTQVAADSMPEEKKVYFDIPEINVANTNEELEASFKGTFHSGGIFEEIEDTLRLNTEDNAFGFSRPRMTYPVYGGKASFDGNLNLNAKGLRGKGELQYLGSAFKSDDFEFYTDSVSTFGNSARIESEQHPRVDMDGYHMRWYVERDSMVFHTEDSAPFRLYTDTHSGDDEILFQGTLALMPEKVAGDGVVEMASSTNKSADFRFNKTTYDSYGSDFRIKSLNEGDKEAVYGKNMHVHGDLTTNQVTIRKEQEDSEIRFPNNMFKTDISQAEWLIDEGIVRMSSGDGEKGEFISVHPEQDELMFNGSHAEYNLKDYSLRATGVEKIRVANADIHPVDSTVVVRTNAEVETLKNATVVFNAFTRYHTIREADIQIKSRKEFEGNGYYQYVNEIGQESKLFFNKFIQQELKNDDGIIEMKTEARGEIMEDDAFLFKPGLLFAGKVRLVDDREKMGFKGKIRLDLEDHQDNWFVYNSKNDDYEAPDSIAAVVVNDDLKIDGLNKRPKAGLYLGMGAQTLLGAFMQLDGNLGSARSVMEADGLLSYDTTKQVYSILPDSYGEYELLKGNQLRYDVKKKEIDFLGKMDLVKSKEKVKYALEAAGMGKMNIEDVEMDSASSFKAEVSLSLLIPMDQRAVKEISKDLGPKDEHEKTSIEKRNLKNFLKRAVQLIPENNIPEEISQEAIFDVMQGLKSEILLSKVDLMWSPTEAAFYSTGEIGMAGMFGEEANHWLQGIIEFPKVGRGANDYTCRMLLKNKHFDTWYYLSFERDGVEVMSSNAAFNEAFTKGKDNVNLADTKKVLQFFDMYSGKYLQNEYPFELNLNVSDWGGAPPSNTDTQRDDILNDTPTPTNTDDDDDGF
ncbi:hypothetical protein V6R21_29935 [Limibacter armeniacum]|uniref:hypothetical protein n=1 Tax=Limibacter armeniacum TaxID=466084 RepID=UPI002FE536BD